MLDPWIIEQIRRREREERQRREQPMLELPLPEPAGPDEYERPAEWPGEPQGERGVVIIGM